eukprot:s82_g38.t1
MCMCCMSHLSFGPRQRTWLRTPSTNFCWGSSQIPLVCVLGFTTFDNQFVKFPKKVKLGSTLPITKKDVLKKSCPAILWIFDHLALPLRLGVSQMFGASLSNLEK